ncbi:photosystem I reaction center subunit PsaK [Thermocoleostomius sinensis]|uniref:Photosystem I reaction center subunit PsaK n=1 Tax=Thermocoleostomius sinensis A174 TaxID=2016057 RepID=A0A9E8Z9S2_9CYAN|nr:photosystem I reaction center subunit PsaK [Thermocoleostomius sinensis]WAL59173.1 photosystem I reaction center subunit PsaK [Thermocoleostomius sinensis A174]
MFYLDLLAVVPRTPEWSLTTALIMVIANAIAIAIARFAIQQPNVGPTLIGDFSVPALIGAACFGHVLGTGAILGLANLGVI